MTFRKRLLTAFGVMMIPLAIIGAQALWNLRKERAALRDLEQSLARARVFAEVESSTYRKIRKIRDHVSGKDPEARREFDAFNARSRARLEDWKASSLDDGDADLTRRFEALENEIDALAQTLFTLHAAGKSDEVARRVHDDLNGRLLPGLDAVVNAIYSTSRQRNVQRALGELRDTSRRTTLVLVAIVAASAVFGSLFSIAASRNLAGPIDALKTAIDRVGAGEFESTRALDVKGNDEVGELARVFLHTAERLKGTQEDLRGKIETLRDTQAQLVQSEKLASLGQMAAAVAHGLRNPLASIRAATQLSARRLPQESPVQEQLAAVIDEVDRLEKRIVHLLDFAKPRASSPEATPVLELLESAAAVFRERLAQQGVALRFDVAPSLPAAWIDPAQIEQAIMEVMSNAIEAMPTGGSLNVVARPAAADAARIEMSFEDSGEGIAAAVADRLTEPFFTTKADGTGLGLAIARRFVELNGGAFRIVAGARRGAVVTLIVPAATRSDGAVA